jgi:hypothetical protein
MQFAIQEPRFRRKRLPLSSDTRVRGKLFKYYLVLPSLEEPVNQIQRVNILRYLIASIRLSSYGDPVPSQIS